MTIRSSRRRITNLSVACPREISNSTLIDQFCAIEFRERADGSAKSTRVKCLTDVYREARKSADALKLFCYLADASVRTDNRVTRYYGLSKQLKREGYHFPDSIGISDVPVVLEGGLKYWQCTELEEGDVPEADRAIMTRDGAFLLLRDALNKAVFRSCVEQHISPVGTTAAEICMHYIHEAGGVCLFPVGGFDDVDVSVFALGLAGLQLFFPDVEVMGTRRRGQIH